MGLFADHLFFGAFSRCICNRFSFCVVESGNFAAWLSKHDWNNPREEVDHSRVNRVLGREVWLVAHLVIRMVMKMLNKMMIKNQDADQDGYQDDLSPPHSDMGRTHRTAAQTWQKSSIFVFPYFRVTIYSQMDQIPIWVRVVLPWDDPYSYSYLPLEWAGFYLEMTPVRTASLPLASRGSGSASEAGDLKFQRKHIEPR